VVDGVVVRPRGCIRHVIIRSVLLLPCILQMHLVSLFFRRQVPFLFLLRLDLLPFLVVPISRRFLPWNLTPHHLPFRRKGRVTQPTRPQQSQRIQNTPLNTQTEIELRRVGPSGVDLWGGRGREFLLLFHVVW
jgi:hypothetical protein